MKRLKRFLILAGVILLYATSPVFADVAILPAFLIVGGMFILAIVIAIIAIVLLVKAIRRRKTAQQIPEMGSAPVSEELKGEEKTDE